MRFVACVALLALASGGCSYLNQKAGLDPDNFVEESVEALIHEHSGLDLDLTPLSPE